MAKRFSFKKIKNFEHARLGKIKTSKGLIKTPAFDVKVVDTTGCGDAFDAGMIAAIVKGFDIEK